MLKLSAKVHYACLAMMDLAQAYERKSPRKIAQIAETENIPSKYLTQILLQLKSARLVSSSRGADGGYQLARRPSAITLADVVDATDGSGGGHEPGGTASGASGEVLESAFGRARRAHRHQLASVTLQTLIDEMHRQGQMYHI